MNIMKTKSILLLAIIFTFLGSSFTWLGTPVAIFDKMEHDYGTLKKGDDGTCYFTITNEGTEALILKDAKGSCSCTVPEWPKEPIAPGESAKIKVKYNTSRVGPINKSVRIWTNADEEPVVLRIKGKVIDAQVFPPEE
jgi:hypothetical protein